MSANWLISESIGTIWTKNGTLAIALSQRPRLGSGEIEIIKIAHRHLDVVGILGENGVGDVVGHHPATRLKVEGREGQGSALIDLLVFYSGLGQIVLVGLKFRILRGRGALIGNHPTDLLSTAPTKPFKACMQNTA
jgi:hypothetical protein